MIIFHNMFFYLCIYIRILFSIDVKLILLKNSLNDVKIIKANTTKLLHVNKSD